MGKRETLRSQLKQKEKELAKVEKHLVDLATKIENLSANPVRIPSDFSDMLRYNQEKHVSLTAKTQINRDITRITHEIGDINRAEQLERSKEWEHNFVEVARLYLSPKKFEELSRMASKAVEGYAM